MLANPLYFFVLILAAAVGASAQADACVLACVQTALANSTCTSLCVVVLCLNFSISRSCHLHPQYRPRLCLQQYELQTDGGQLPHCQLYRCGSADCPSTSTTRMRQYVFSRKLYFHNFSPLTRLPSFVFYQYQQPYFQFDEIPLLHFQVFQCYRPHGTATVPHCCYRYCGSCARGRLCVVKAPSDRGPTLFAGGVGRGWLRSMGQLFSIVYPKDPTFV